MNLQQIEKAVFRTDGWLDIHHIFKTIQGEGPFAGTPAIFIRLAGCNLQCPLCDTDYTSHRTLLDPLQVAVQVNDIAGAIKLVVITGGEPLRQNIVPVVERLIEHRFNVQVETNGTLWIPELPVQHENFSIVCSPKTPRLNLDLVEHLIAFKYILHADYIDPEDGLPTISLGLNNPTKVARPPEEIYGYDFDGLVYVQPVDVGDPKENKRHLDAAIKSCMKYNYTLCLQTQKIIGLE